ncbi:MAG: DUF2358 domain-containing protein [Cyanobacteria bacterium J06621_11]
MQTTEQIIGQLKTDYARFPQDQSYGLYAKDVQFEDPLNSFSGVEKYQKMIGFLSRFFRDIEMELHDIEETNPELITTHWTLNMTAPAPWAPRLSITGRSELGLNSQQLINSHIDYWNCSRLDVLKQVFKS